MLRYAMLLCYVMLCCYSILYSILYYILYYIYYINLMELPSLMRRIPVFADRQHCLKHYICPIQAVSESSQIQTFIEMPKKKKYTETVKFHLAVRL
jgi:hypothetical protein